MEDQRNNHEKDGLGGLFASIVGLGEATTKFTINQMQNAVGILTHPMETVDRMRDSLDHLSEAMHHSIAPAERTVVDSGEPARVSETLTGRKQ
jgi:hypothetical protein